jgi:hypothetical protein
MQTRIGASVLSIALLGTGCASHFIDMNVKAYADPERSLATARSFTVLPMGLTMKDPLLEKELLFLVKQRLMAKGLVYDEQKPDVLVALVGYIGPFERYVQPSTFYWPMPTSTSSTTNVLGTVDSTRLSGTATTTTSGTQYVPITRQGYTVTQYYRNIQVVMGERVSKNGAANVDVVWSGEVDSSGYSADLVVVAPTLLDQLLAEFPRRTGSPTTRRVRWTPPRQANR